MPDLICTCCGGPLTPDRAAPAPEGVTLRYHLDIRDCLAATLACIQAGQRPTAVMAACVGWDGREERDER